MVDEVLSTVVLLGSPDGEPGDRARLVSTNVHGLLHIHKAIRDNGPQYVWWEWSLERFCGDIKRWRVLDCISTSRRPGPAVLMKQLGVRT
jgi:hypothetical protein